MPPQSLTLLHRCWRCCVPCVYAMAWPYAPTKISSQRTCSRVENSCCRPTSLTMSPGLTPDPGLLPGSEDRPPPTPWVEPCSPKCPRSLCLFLFPLLIPFYLCGSVCLSLHLPLPLFHFLLCQLLSLSSLLSTMAFCLSWVQWSLSPISSPFPISPAAFAPTYSWAALRAPRSMANGTLR